MTREEADALIGDVMADHFERLRSTLELELEKMVARKPVPPFVPPATWQEGKRHGAGTVVRWRNGLFSAQRDTDEEPATDSAWLPLVVGVADVEMRWLEDGHSFVCSVSLSDGRVVEHQQQLAVPIVRGYWNAETTYMPGDRVFRYGEHHALKVSLGVDPTSDGAADHWEKVGGKYLRPLTLAISEDGDITESGHIIGSLKPLVRELFRDLAANRAA